MLQVILKQSTLAAAFLLGASALALPQAAAPDEKAVEAAKSATLSRQSQLRDEFIKATAASDLPCPIPPPTIVITDIPSYGNYNPESNTLQTPTWEILQQPEKAIFFRLAGPGSDEAAARREFETGAHHWVFIHEMGHWWQACRKVNDGRKPWAFEYEADRIDAAYWRMKDPNIDSHMQTKFSALVERAPSPVPAGLDTATYFNDNYQKLGPTPAYIWFQSQMCLRAFAESPAPAFAQTLRETGHP